YLKHALVDPVRRIGGGIIMRAYILRTNRRSGGRIDYRRRSDFACWELRDLLFERTFQQLRVGNSQPVLGNKRLACPVRHAVLRWKGGNFAEQTVALSSRFVSGKDGRGRGLRCPAHAAVSLRLGWPLKSAGL